jgi:hypothetical protein
MLLSPSMHEPIATDPSALLGLVVSLLPDRDARGGRLRCTLLPPGDHHGIRLDAPANAGTAVLLPRRPLERALRDPWARAWVSHLLRSAIETLRARQAGTTAHLAAYFAALDVRSLPGPRCMSCDGPLLAEAPVVIRDSARWHLACPPAW